MKIDGGRLKVWFDRMRWYSLFVQFAFILSMWLENNSILWWYWLFIPLGLMWLAFDIKHIYPKEVKYVWSRNPDFLELRRDVKEIKEKLYEK